MIYSELDNETLVNLTLLGNDSAYEALVIRYQKAVISAAMSVTHDRFFAEDAAQDAFVSAWMRLDTLRESEKFGAWVCRISRNRAKNIMIRHREWIDFDEVENQNWEADEDFLYGISPNEEYELLHAGIGNLSKKVREVIVMHYFEGLSIAEIADKLRIPVGTVKYRLHDGREKLRKDMGDDMNENTDKTFTEKVMQKVEEIKKWVLKNNKDGFEKLYREVLSELDSLPESEEKYYALADVLVRGSWWIPGEKNDALMERIREAAEKGRNEEVIITLLANEHDNLSGKDRISLIRDKQIPRMREQGYPKAEAYLWFWMGCEHFKLGESDLGYATYQKVLSLLTPADVYYANALAAIRAEKKYLECQDSAMITTVASAIHLRMIDEKLRFWQEPGYRHGDLCLMSGVQFDLLWEASCCDRTFYDPQMKVGESSVGSHSKHSLTYLNDNATAETACGTFYNCQLWETQDGPSTVRAYYKHNIGIVRFEHLQGSHLEIQTLKSYHIAGGTGLIPLAAGNRWEYTCSSLNPKSFAFENLFEVTSFDGENAILYQYGYLERVGIDEESWKENMLYMRNHYVMHDMITNKSSLRDVSIAMKQAEKLAATPLEKAHTRVANKVMQRIHDTDGEFSPQCTAIGGWNFFVYNDVAEDEQKIQLIDNRVYSFEWKNGKEVKYDTPGYCLLYNHIYSIFSDAFDDCLWKKDWKIGDSGILKFSQFGKNTENEYSIEDAGTVTTAAGAFENCMLVRAYWKNVPGGWHYRGGKMEYYFAPNVGLIRAVHYFKHETMSAVYDLTSYQGTGEGYFPLFDGMVRHYDGIGLAKGYVGATEYTCARAEDGHLVLLADCTGIREILENNTENTAN